MKPMKPRKVKHQKMKPPAYERVLVYGGTNRTVAWEALVPTPVLWENIDPSARKDQDELLPRWAWSCIASVVGMFLFYAFGFMAGGLELGILAAILGAPLGASLGWLIAPRLVTPIWMVRRNVDKETGEIIIEPIQTISRHVDAEDPRFPPLQVPASRAMYRTKDMRAARERYSGGPPSWDRFAQIGSFIMMAIALAVIVFIFSVATSEDANDGGSNNGPSTAARTGG